MAQAMNVSVKELFKIMEKGQLDPMTALPKLAKLMASLTADQMEEFRKSLPYMQGRSLEARQNWLKDFSAAGATAGLTKFWEVLAYITEEAGASAQSLGRLTGRIIEIGSGIMLIPTEVRKWFEGTDKDAGNIMQYFFGDVEKSPLAQSTLSFLEEIKTTFSGLKEAFTPITDALKEIASGMIVMIPQFLDKMSTLIGFMAAIVSSAVSLSLKPMQDFKTRYEDKEWAAEESRRAAKAVGREDDLQWQREHSEMLLQSLGIKRGLNSKEVGEGSLGFWVRSNNRTEDSPTHGYSLFNPNNIKPLGNPEHNIPETDRVSFSEWWSSLNLLKDTSKITDAVEPLVNAYKEVDSTVTQMVYNSGVLLGDIILDTIGEAASKFSRDTGLHRLNDVWNLHNYKLESTPNNQPIIPSGTSPLQNNGVPSLPKNSPDMVSNTSTMNDNREVRIFYEPRIDMNITGTSQEMIDAIGARFSQEYKSGEQRLLSEVYNVFMNSVG